MFWGLIIFILGLGAGWLLKYAFDFYHYFKEEEQKRANQLEELLIKWRTIEKLSHLENGTIG